MNPTEYNHLLNFLYQMAGNPVPLGEIAVTAESSEASVAELLKAAIANGEAEETPEGFQINGTAAAAITRRIQEERKLAEQKVPELLDDWRGISPIADELQISKGMVQLLVRQMVLDGEVQWRKGRRAWVIEYKKR